MFITVYNTYTYISRHFNILPQITQNKIIKGMCYYKKTSFKNFSEVCLFITNPYNQTLNNYYQFPTGLLWRFIDLLNEHKIQYQLSDGRGPKPPQIPIEEYYQHIQKVDPKLERREYQEDTLKTCLWRCRGIVEAATASGKTIIIGGITFCVNCRTLILCIGKEHVVQIAEDIAKLTDRKVTVISAGEFNSRGEIVVANVQKLQAFKDNSYSEFQRLLKTFHCLIVDEIHHAAAISWKEIIHFCTKAYYKFGFSGTVFREDNAMLELIGGTGQVIAKTGYTYLTEHNFITQARFMVMDPLCNHLSNDKDTWPNCVKYGIVEEEHRNNWIKNVCELYNRNKMQVLIITPFRVAHGKILEEIIPESRFVYGNTNNQVRKRLLQNFKNKEFNVIISSTIYDEVINLPDVRCVFLVGAGKARNKIFQRIGRGIRKAVGKDHVDIIIPWDSHSRILLNHAQENLKFIKTVDVWKNHIHYLGQGRWYDDYKIELH